MKRILFLFLLVFSSASSYSQLSFNEMVSVYNMNLDQFENFSLKKGYAIYRFKDDIDIYGVTYNKGIGGNSNFISLYSRWYKRGIVVNTQTFNEKLFLLFKEQLQQNNFKLVSTSNFDGVLTKDYVNKDWEVSTYSGKNSYGAYYETTLYKR